MRGASSLARTTRKRDAREPGAEAVCRSVPITAAEATYRETNGPHYTMATRGPSPWRRGVARDNNEAVSHGPHGVRHAIAAAVEEEEEVENMVKGRGSEGKG